MLFFRVAFPSMMDSRSWSPCSPVQASERQARRSQSSQARCVAIDETIVIYRAPMTERSLSVSLSFSLLPDDPAERKETPLTDGRVSQRNMPSMIRCSYSSSSRKPRATTHARGDVATSRRNHVTLAKVKLSPTAHPLRIPRIDAGERVSDSPAHD